MYSSSNSFLGGTNNARPGQPPLGQQPALQQPYSGFPPQGQQQQQQQPQGGFAPQPTGFGGGHLQPQLTGFPQPQQQPGGFQQPQYTGYPPQSQPQQQQQQHVPQLSTQQPQLQHQQQHPQLPQPQQQSQLSAPSASHLHPHQTSAQVAQSFQGAGSGPAQQQHHPPQDSHSKIPNIRLSFITAQDQAKFEQLFKSAAGDGQSLDGWYTLVSLGLWKWLWWCADYLDLYRRESEGSTSTIKVIRQ